MKLKISELGKVITGNTPSKKIKEFWDKDDVGFVKPDIISDEHIVKIKSEDCNEFISNAAISKARIVPKNSIFVTCIGNIGKIGVATENLAFNQQINAIIPNENVNLDYLCYAIFANKTRLQDIANAPIVPLLNKSQFSEFELEFDMDINTQTRIVHELNTVCNIILKYKQELLLLDELVRARFVEMFGDENNSKGWEIVNIEDVANVQVGVVIKPSQYYTDQYNGIKAFRSLNIGNGYIKDDDWVYFSREGNKKNKKSILSTNDVLVVRSGAPGTACVVTSEYAGSNAIDVIIAHPDFQKVDSHYLCTYTNMPHGKSQIIEGTGGAAQQHFNVGKYNKLKLMLPPLEYQKQYVKFLEEIDKSRLLSNHSLFLIKSIIF